MPVDNAPLHGYLTPDTFTPAGYICGRLRIPNERYFLAAVMGALADLVEADSWEPYGTMSPEDAAYLALTMYNDFVLHRGMCMIGTIVAIATADPPTGTLLCNGTTYNRTDYPDLYAALLPIYRADADHFITPDLRGLIVMGAPIAINGTTYIAGDTLGEYDHTLDVGEIPVHSHTNTPHAHSVTDYINVPVPAGVDPVFASSMTGYPSSTGLSGVAIDNTGGGNPHNNVQPSALLQYAIVAL
jgi:microcystin-dependent protein